MIDDDSFATLSQEQKDRWVTEQASSGENFVLQKTNILRRIGASIISILVQALMIAIFAGIVAGLTLGANYIIQWISA